MGDIFFLRSSGVMSIQGWRTMSCQYNTLLCIEPRRPSLDGPRWSRELSNAPVDRMSKWIGRAGSTSRDGGGLGGDVSTGKTGHSGCRRRMESSVGYGGVSELAQLSTVDIHNKTA